MITTYAQYELYYAAKTALDQLRLLIIEENPTTLCVEFEDGSTKTISIHELDDYKPVKCTIYDTSLESSPSSLKNLHSYMPQIPIETYRERLKLILANHSRPPGKLSEADFHYLSTGTTLV